MMARRPTRWCQRLARSLVLAPVPLLIRQNRHKIKKPEPMMMLPRNYWPIWRGFYSAFMVAEKIEVLSRRHGSDQANLWVVTPVGVFNQRCMRDDIGTDITLHLRKEGKEYLDQERIHILLKNILITLPSRLVGLGPKVEGSS